MDYEILEYHVKIQFLDTQFAVCVAIESSPGRFKAYTAIVDSVAYPRLREITSVAATGTKMSKSEAEEMFPLLKGTYKYEG